jgi:hypothetical protein
MGKHKLVELYYLYMYIILVPLWLGVTFKDKGIRIAAIIYPCVILKDN